MTERKLTDLELIGALCEIEFGLSEWEVDFVESLAKQVEGGMKLSDKQRAKAEAIIEAKS